MKLTLKHINCNDDFPFKINELADSCIEFHIEFDRILTMQSKKVFLDQLKNEIQIELKKIKWLITGKVQLNINWFLNSVNRQETDKIGDLDNITKPLIDCLSGVNGVIIDDSQFNSIHTSWGTSNLSKTDNLVIMKLQFINDWTVNKENLYFLEISTAIYTPLNFNIDSKNDIKGIKLFLNAAKAKRIFSESFKNINLNVDRYLVYSEYDFHRTRLSSFQNDIILNETNFKTLCDKHKI